jgi:hypothetical protein
MALVKVNIDSFKRDAGGLVKRTLKNITNKLEDKLENAVEDLFAKALKKVGFSDRIAAELSARFGDSLTVGLEDKYFQTFTSEMKRASCADIRNNFNPQNGNLIGASAFAETYVDAIQRASNKIGFGDLPSMQFPDHISEKYYMAFKFKRYERPSPHTQSELKFVQAFALPLPKGLRETFDISVAEGAQGLKGGIADVAQLGLSGGLTAQGATNAALALAYGAMVQATGDIGSAVAQGIGAVPNPHVQALFSGVPLRTHRFEWTFSPRNANESQQLMNLLKAMKAYSLPSYSSLGTAALAYPFLCQPEIKINDSAQLIKFQPCLIQSIELNYSPQGIPAFFEGTSHPAFIECSITMLETQIQTSRDYGREGGDNLSNTSEAVLDGLQKGIDNITGKKGSELRTFLDDTGKTINKFISPTAPTTSSPKEQREG